MSYNFVHVHTGDGREYPFVNLVPTLLYRFSGKARFSAVVEE